MIDAIREQRAEKEFAAIRNFYLHVLLFVPFMLLLGAVDALSGTGIWVHWIGVPWAAALLVHGYDAFVAAPKRLADWERREIEEERGHAAI